MSHGKKESIFREKSLERISSPDQVNDYLRVANPGIWVFLLAILVLLAGAFVWGIFGVMETKVTGAALIRQGEVHIYADSEAGKQIKEGMKVRIDGQIYKVSAVDPNPVKSDELDEYVCYEGNIPSGSWAVHFTASGPELPNGTYPAEVIIEEVNPITFITN